MHPSIVANLCRRHTRLCDVFINHRGVDTKRTAAGLLHDSLTQLNVRPFLDSETMKPGDKLFETIHSGIRECKVAVVIFSPNYCNSYFCLHELALIMECNKKVIPIFWDIKPSQLFVSDSSCGCFSEHEIKRFRWGVDEARYKVGITFDSCTGNWPKFLRKTTDNVMKSLIEVEEERSPSAPIISYIRKGGSK